MDLVVKDHRQGVDPALGVLDSGEVRGLEVYYDQLSSLVQLHTTHETQFHVALQKIAGSEQHRQLLQKMKQLTTLLDVTVKEQNMVVRQLKLNKRKASAAG